MGQQGLARRKALAGGRLEGPGWWAATCWMQGLVHQGILSKWAAILAGKPNAIVAGTGGKAVAGKPNAIIAGTGGKARDPGLHAIVAVGRKAMPTLQAHGQTGGGVLPKSWPKTER